jgi:hypothetical protein
MEFLTALPRAKRPLFLLAHSRTHTHTYTPVLEEKRRERAIPVVKAEQTAIAQMVCRAQIDGLINIQSTNALRSDKVKERKVVVVVLSAGCDAT